MDFVVTFGGLGFAFDFPFESVVLLAVDFVSWVAPLNGAPGTNSGASTLSP